MLDNRRALPAARTDRLALYPFSGEFQRLLIGPLDECDTLKTDGVPRRGEAMLSLAVLR